MDTYDNPTVKQWVRTTGEIIMELSNGTFQVHLKESQLINII